MVPDGRVGEIVSRLTGVPGNELKYGIPLELPLFFSLDSLERIELIMELEEEFDKETVMWGLRYTQALADRAYSVRRFSVPPLQSQRTDSFWDRELDACSQVQLGYNDQREGEP
jgi:acyl carrier protein